MIASTYNLEVILYSYKSRIAPSKIKQMLENASGANRIIVRFLDQYQLDRSKNFYNSVKEYDDFHKIFYHHIFWDYIQSPIKIQEQRIKSSTAQYILLIDDTVNFNKNWDAELIDFIQDKNIIISGNGSPLLEQENDFFIKHEIYKEKDFSLTQYISKNFIFGPKKVFFDIENNGYILPSYLKYFGFEEVLSLQCFAKNIDIFSCPSTVYQCDNFNNFDSFNLYVPFSKIHNYNEVIKLFKNGYNDYNHVGVHAVESFIDFHGFDFKSLEFLPYEKNDVPYATQDSVFDRMDGRRFLDNVKSIN